jgi:hypothetical protein
MLGLLSVLPAAPEGSASGLETAVPYKGGYHECGLMPAPRQPVSYRRVGIEQTPVLVEGETIGHAGQIIGYDPSAIGIIATDAASGLGPPLARQAIRLGEEQLKQFVHDAARF